jgi:hypothetical protein
LVEGFHVVLVGSREFSALRQAVLKNVLGVGAVRRCPYLVAKPSQVRIDEDEISCPLHHPTACGCQPDAMSLWFVKVLPYLVAKLFFG